MGAFRLVLRLLLLAIGVTFLLGGAALVAQRQSSVTYAQRSSLGSGPVDVSCRSSLAGLTSMGTAEPSTWYDGLRRLKPGEGDQLWSRDNDACLKHQRINLAIGFVIALLGVALLVLRRRLPGRLRDLQPTKANAPVTPRPRVAV